MTTPRTARAVLHRDLIVATAVALVDEGGLDALSLRGVAARLGVTPMPLYRHVSGIDELTGLVVDELLAREGQAPLPTGWQPLLRVVALRTHAALSRHPAVFEAIRRRATTSPASLDGLEALLAAFDRDGHGPEVATAAYASVLLHVLGHVALVQGRRQTLEALGVSEADERTRVREQLAAADPATHPHLAAGAAHVAGLLDEAVMLDGLDLLLEAWARRLG